MNLYSLESLLILLAIAAVFFVLPGPHVRRFAFAACSLGFLSTYVPNPLSWAVLLIFLVSGYGCALALRGRYSGMVFTLYLVLLVTAFAILKRYEVIKPIVPNRILDLPVDIVGLSYMLFRQIHFLVDMVEGQIENPTLWSYLNYQSNPFALIAGPIQRYQDFQAYWVKPEPLHHDRHELLKAYMRLFWGMIKILLISEAFHSIYDWALGQLDVSRPAGGALRTIGVFVVMLYSFMFYLYMNFSGYCDVVIAAAGLVGLKLPENFHAPFSARNILDYWSRWHITLGHWIRDYLFTPFYKAGVERWPRYATSVALAGYFVAFTVAGVWHGSTWNFLVYGLLHGAGASAAKLWETVIVRYAGRPGLKKYLKSASIRAVAVFGTFNYACFTLLFFAMGLERGWRILGTVVSSFHRFN